MTGWVADWLMDWLIDWLAVWRMMMEWTWVYGLTIKLLASSWEPVVSTSHLQYSFCLCCCFNRWSWLHYRPHWNSSVNGQHPSSDSDVSCVSQGKFSSILCLSSNKQSHQNFALHKKKNAVLLLKSESRAEKHTTMTFNLYSCNIKQEALLLLYCPYNWRDILSNYVQE